MIAILFISSLSPQFFPYFTDFMLCALSVIYIRDKRVIFACLSILCFAASKAIISEDLITLRHLLPMLRPFLVLGLILSLIKSEKLFNNQKNLIFWSIISVVVTFSVNLVGYFSHDDYVMMNNFWNGNERFLGNSDSTVASIAASQYRYSSIFAQPAAAGLAFFAMFYSLLIIRKKIPAFLFIGACGAVVLSGFLSKSSFFSSSLLLFFVLNACLALISKKHSKLIFFGIIFSPTVLTFLFLNLGVSGIGVFGEDVLGARFNEGSHLLLLFASLEWSDYIFGVDGFYSSGLRIGDNAVLMRVVLAGVFFNLIYLLMLSLVILIVIENISSKKSFCANIAFYSVIGFGELGFTSFSQPGIVFLIFVPTLLILAQEVRPVRLSVRAPSTSDYGFKQCAES